MAAKALDWESAVGQKARVYRNLNNGLISVQLKRLGKGWFVAGHVNNAVLSGITLHVSEKGRQRVLQEHCKNVHAWAQAEVLLGAFDSSLVATVDLKYNPYTDHCFVERCTQRPLQVCQYLVVRDNRVFVSADAVREPEATPKLLQLKLTPFNLQSHNFALNLGVA